MTDNSKTNPCDSKTVRQFFAVHETLPPGNGNAGEKNTAALADRIVYFDSRFVLVNKCAGEAVEGAGSGMIDLPRILGQLDFPEAENPGETPCPPTACHRLDVPVTGLCLFARTKEALAFAGEQFRNGSVRKSYYAIAEKPPGGLADTALADTALENMFSGKSAREGPAFSHTLVHWIEEGRFRSRAFDEKAPGRKRAEMRCRIFGEGERVLFLEIEISAGRHHQIRAQLEKEGLHIRGDLKYGARRSEKGGGIRLHAARLEFNTGKNIRRSFSARPIMAMTRPDGTDRLWNELYRQAEAAPDIIP